MKFDNNNINIIVQIVIIVVLVFLIYKLCAKENLCVKKNYGYITDVPVSTYVDANMALVITLV